MNNAPRAEVVKRKAQDDCDPDEAGCSDEVTCAVGTTPESVIYIRHMNITQAVHIANLATSSGTGVLSVVLSHLELPPGTAVVLTTLACVLLKPEDLQSLGRTFTKEAPLVVLFEAVRNFEVARTICFPESVFHPCVLARSFIHSYICLYIYLLVHKHCFVVVC